MKRIQLFEFEDLTWFPGTLRRSMTNLIAVLHRMVGTEEVIASQITGILGDYNYNTIVDLGSGSGGIMPKVLEKLRSDHGHKDLRLILSDLYPNKDSMSRWDGHGHISYFPKPLNATELSGAPEGLKTMINCFHHMDPEHARMILQTARDKKQPMFIYEMGENNIPLFLWWLLLPVSLFILMLMVLFMTPWVRPLSWQQLLFTYIIPIIPISYAWDGQASLPRMYTMKDLDLLLADLHGPEYRWSKGPALKKNNKKLGTFLIGLPRN